MFPELAHLSMVFYFYSVPLNLVLGEILILLPVESRIDVVFRATVIQQEIVCQNKFLVRGHRIYRSHR